MKEADVTIPHHVEMLFRVTIILNYIVDSLVVVIFLKE